MYKSERIIIDTRIYDIDEIFERYRRGNLIFYKKISFSKVQKNRITQEVLQALSKGIPFPPVYVSELQTGEMLVLDKSDRLRFLMEYLDGRFEMNPIEYPTEELYRSSEPLKDIYYSTVILHVIDYMNPRYMHMQTGSFIEEWSAVQEQGVRNILYQREVEYIFGNLLNGMYVPSRSVLSTQYRFIYFIMVDFVVSESLKKRRYQKADKFQLLEEVLYESMHMAESFMRDLYAEYEGLYHMIRQEDYKNGFLPHMSLETQTKYLCFASVLREIRGGVNFYKIFENRALRKMIEDCDMSYRDICVIMECFERGIYD